MKIHFHGAARQVTGSSHLLEVNSTKILLDCGLFQGRRKESFQKNREFPFKASEIDAVVLSHAHIDHSGNLPSLIAAGFKGRIVCTEATHDLCEWMLRDAAYIQEKDVLYVNKKRKRKGQNPFEPLYTMKDAVRTLERFKGVEYAREVEVAPGVAVTFRDAGHILGSASCRLKIDESGKERVILYTGDIGRPERPILRDPVPPSRADVLICESTYGNRLHEARQDVAARLQEVVKETYERGGKVLIPAFSVGRTQRLVYHLHELFREGALPPMPIFVDSPLSTNVTSVFRDHPECLDEEAMKLHEYNNDPFGFSRLTYIRDVAASKALNELSSPCLIIAASGMCEAGRVLHHLKKIAPVEKNTILIVGFMAAHTLGRRIAEKVQTIKLYGDEFPLRAQVESIPGLSAHADQQEILDYLDELENPPEASFLVHGEEESILALADKLRERGHPRVEAPNPGDVFKV